MGKRTKCRPIFNHVPAELMEEILYKLPVKSLLRFKCVSKPWRSSISSKGFIAEHLNRSNSGTDFAHHNLTFTYHEHSDEIRCIGSLPIGSLLNDDESNRPNLSIPIPIPIPISIPAWRDTDAIACLCSCNGLILITVNRSELYLCNPSTRKAKYIRNPRETASWECCYRSGYGLGYDKSTDDYKVVCSFFDVSQLMDQRYMYSSKTGSWKIIQSLYKGSLSRPAKFVNGRMHWLNDKGRDRATTSRYIVSLDLVEEKFQIVPLPHSMSDDYYSHYTCLLEDLGGYLSFVGNNYVTSSRDVWVMQKESWSKIWTFTDQTLPLPMPLLLKTNGDILVAFGLDLTIYHGEDKLRQSRVDMLEVGFDRVVYVESLVSPFGDDEQLHCH